MTDVAISVQSYNIQVNVTIPVPTVDTTLVQLTDSSGIDAYEIKDSDGFTIFKVDSKGNVFTRRAIKRI